MSLEIGVILPTSTPDPERPILGDVREAARYAESVGLDSVWSTDHLVASAPLLDSSVVLATAAAVTERITVGYNVMLLALRPVAWAAKQVNTLQLVSNNRVVLGVGTGNPAHGDAGWRAAGVEYAERGRLTDEALAVLRDLIAGEPATVAEDVEVTLSPARRCHRSLSQATVREPIAARPSTATAGRRSRPRRTRSAPTSTASTNLPTANN